MEASVLRWRKSSYSGGSGGGCVEVATAPAAVLVRDSKDRSGPILSVSRSDWRTFLTGLDR